MEIHKKVIAVIRSINKNGTDFKTSRFVVLTLFVFIANMTFLLSVLGVNLLVAVFVSTTIILLITITVMLWTTAHFEKKK